VRLQSLTIENFRSITTAYKLSLSSSTVLIGPNNEGKSNVLRALVLATRILLGRRAQDFPQAPLHISGPRHRREADYEWERDFPLHLQGKKASGHSVFILEYKLSAAEIGDFNTFIGSTLSGNLPLQVAIGPSRTPTVTIRKKGPGGAKLSAKAAKVAAFVAERIDLEYIPAVRTADSARDVVYGMVARELAALESNAEYVDALDKIAELQRPVLADLSKSIQDTLVQFLPDVNTVEVRTATERRLEAMRRCEIFIDDGSMTELRYKGDGVQSLAALGLMRHASAKGATGKDLVVAIEEPESHLHPLAIRKLREVVEQLGASHQVVVTTHCPLFVSRRNVASNIIVNAGKAKQAKTIKQIREVLGVRAADNLMHAELVLVVEGEDDKISIEALCAAISPALAAALGEHRLAVDTLAGASNLGYKLGLLRDALCEYHVLLDADDAGNAAFDKAKNEGLLTDADVNLTRCGGMTESEFEDLLDEILLLGVIDRGIAERCSQLGRGCTGMGEHLDVRLDHIELVPRNGRVEQCLRVPKGHAL